MLRAFLVALAVVFVGIQPANAQEPTPQQYESVMRWAGGHQQIIQMATGPLQQMPILGNMNDRRERRAWTERARTWVADYRSQIRVARTAIESLGPVPEAGDLSAPYRLQEDALPSMIDSMDNFLTQYERGIVAIERNDPTAAVLADVNAADAQILIMTQFRNINALQAETISDGPQRYLLRSFANSYDAMIAVARERRAYRLGERISPASVAVVRASADAMAENSRQGRLAAQRETAALPAQAPPEQGDFLRRVRLAYQTFDGSFAREEEIAAHIGAIADAMRSATSYGEIEESIDAHIERAGTLDGERIGDIQRRTQLVQMIVPPT